MTNLPLEVAELLREHAINGQVLESLTEEDLVSIGVNKFGWRRQLLLSRRELCEQLDLEDAISEEDGAEGIEFHSLSEECSGSSAPFFKETPPPLCSLSRQESVGGGLINLTPAKVRQQLPQQLPTGLSLTGSPKSSSVADSLQGSDNTEMALMKEIRTRLEQKGADAHIADTHAPVTTAEISVPVESAGVAYRVDNSRLRSGLEGLEFHRSMSLSDTSSTHGKAVVPWGAIVYGTPFGSDWVKVGDFYLPTRLNGVPVLQRLLRRPSLSVGTSESKVLPSDLVRSHSPRNVATPASMSWAVANGYVHRNSTGGYAAVHYSPQKATPRSVTRRLSPTVAPRAASLVQDMMLRPPASTQQWTLAASPRAWLLGARTFGSPGVPGVQHGATYDAAEGFLHATKLVPSS